MGYISIYTIRYFQWLNNSMCENLQEICPYGIVGIIKQTLHLKQIDHMLTAFSYIHDTRAFPQDKLFCYYVQTYIRKIK